MIKSKTEEQRVSLLPESLMLKLHVSDSLYSQALSLRSLVGYIAFTGLQYVKPYKYVYGYCSTTKVYKI